jgi:hypothetical protein
MAKLCSSDYWVLPLLNFAIAREVRSPDMGNPYNCTCHPQDDDSRSGDHNGDKSPADLGCLHCCLPAFPFCPRPLRCIRLTEADRSRASFKMRHYRLVSTLVAYARTGRSWVYAPSSALYTDARPILSALAISVTPCQPFSSPHYRRPIVVCATPKVRAISVRLSPAWRRFNASCRW